MGDKSARLRYEPKLVQLWAADFRNPDGYGIGAEAWFAEQAAKKDEE
jgi:hypothetical protein